MATIIAGEFATTAETDAATAALKAANFDPTNISVFLLNPPGQHALHALGGDEDADRGASHAHNGAVSGALVGATVGLGVGIAAMAASETGPAVAATVAAAGAYAGSLVGALNKVGDDEIPTGDARCRHAGAMVAVNAKSALAKKRAIAVLQAHGAKQIEQAEGRWENGKWLDFDPRITPNLVGGDMPDRGRQPANGAAH